MNLKLLACKDKVIVEPIKKEQKTASGILLSTNDQPQYLNKGKVISYGSDCGDLINKYNEMFVYFYPYTEQVLEINNNIYFVLRYDNIIAIEGE